MPVQYSLYSRRYEYTGAVFSLQQALSVFLYSILSATGVRCMAVQYFSAAGVRCMSAQYSLYNRR